MSVNEVYDLLNYQTNGRELERVYTLAIKKVISNLKNDKRYFSSILDQKEGLLVGEITSLMKEVYPVNKLPSNSSHFYPLHFLRQLKILNIKKDDKKTLVYLNRKVALRVFTEYGFYIDLPLSCLILEQLKKLPDENINKYYYYIIRKIIYENRVRRYGANREADLIQKPAPNFEKSNWRPNINHVKYGFFSNVVDYFYFEKNSYIFNLRFIKDLLRYVMIVEGSQYANKYSKSLQKFFETISKELISITTMDNSIFQGLLIGLLCYYRYSDLSNLYKKEVDILLKLDYKTDIGLIYEFDYDKQTGNKIMYDFIQITSKHLGV